MTAIDIVVAAAGPLRWQALVAERLRQAGHDVALVGSDTPAALSGTAAAALWLERKLLRSRSELLAAVTSEPVRDEPGRAAMLVLDLAGGARRSATRTLSLTWDGSPSVAAAAAALAGGRLPDLAVLLDGETILAEASPMVDNRYLVAAGLDDVLARAVTLIVSTVARLKAGTTQGCSPRAPAAGPSFLSSYLLSALPRLAAEMLRRARFRFAHWRVGFRFVDGPGVAVNGRLGNGWMVLPDDGERFFADPFPVEWQGRHFVFVEDYSHAASKAVISVAEVHADGSASPPRRVIEEPHHLSYPQVFARDGEMWMLPEGSAGHELTLYRAESFPDHWVRHAVLMADCELSDATLFEHGGRHWLFATNRDAHGSTSDTLVVFHALQIEGPWVPHPMNPITIDRAAARPGGAPVRVDGRTLLPLQDGTLGYGCGLGLAEIIELSETTVRLARPVPIDATGDFPYPQIHTLNRAGRLEVIDGIAAVRKR